MTGRCNFPYPLLFLPSHIKPRRLQQIRRLQIQWCANGRSLVWTMFSRSSGLLPPSKLIYWNRCWGVLAGMKELEELVIEFALGDHLKSIWRQEQTAALEGAQAVKVKTSFIIVLPFDECVMDHTFGIPKCRILLPRQYYEQPVSA